MGRSQDLYKKAKTLIPGGTQLLSKRPELFLPDFWPAYYDRAKGCEVWDLDGNKYIDMITMGIGTCILGFADEDVDKAVKDAVDRGTMTSLNSPQEVELAELLCDLHPWASMVRYSRTGGEAMAIAVRIARAFTKKDKILFCGYHGWHDFYLSANLSDNAALDGHLLPGLNPGGVPRALKGHSLTFNYNDTGAFIKLIDEYGDNTAAVILECIRNSPPDPEFIEAIRKKTAEKKIVFIVDEITSGWRLNLGGAHLLYSMEPDIAVFAKAMSNGYPMSAVIGKSSVMESAQDSFISSTYWTYRIGPAAALATIEKMKKLNVQEHLIAVGKAIQEGWKNLSGKKEFSLNISGIFPLSHFEFIHENPSALKTLFTQLMLEKGFLASTVFYSSFAHKEENIKSYLAAVDEVFGFISSLISRGDNPEKNLRGPVCHSGFKRLN